MKKLFNDNNDIHTLIKEESNVSKSLKKIINSNNIKILLLIFVISIIIAFIESKVKFGKNAGLRSFIYTNISDELKFESDISNKRFASDIELVDAMKYTSFKASEINAETNDNSAVMICFKHAYSSLYTVAFPMLTDYELTATVFIDAADLEPDSMLCEQEQLEEMYSTGTIDIGVFIDEFDKEEIIDLKSKLESKFDCEITSCYVEDPEILSQCAQIFNVCLVNGGGLSDPIEEAGVQNISTLNLNETQNLYELFSN